MYTLTLLMNSTKDGHICKPQNLSHTHPHLFYFIFIYYYLFIYDSFIGFIFIVFIWAHSILILAQPRPNFPYPYVRTHCSHFFSFLISTIYSKSQTLKAHLFPILPPTHNLHLFSFLFSSFLSFYFLFFLSISSFFISSSTPSLPSCRRRCCYSHHFQSSLPTLAN